MVFAFLHTDAAAMFHLVETDFVSKLKPWVGDGEIHLIRKEWGFLFQVSGPPALACSGKIEIGKDTIKAEVTKIDCPFNHHYPNATIFHVNRTVGEYGLVPLAA